MIDANKSNMVRNASKTAYCKPQILELTNLHTAGKTMSFFGEFDFNMMMYNNAGTS